jgi:hypothetical protein
MSFSCTIPTSTLDQLEAFEQKVRTLRTIYLHNRVQDERENLREAGHLKWVIRRCTERGFFLDLIPNAINGW